MRYWLALAALALMVFSNPAAADPSPTTTNQVSGPVTGALPDKIALSLDPYQSAMPGLRNRAQLTVSAARLSVMKQSW